MGGPGVIRLKYGMRFAIVTERGATISAAMAFTPPCPVFPDRLSSWRHTLRGSAIPRKPQSQDPPPSPDR
jgi:hypothetical protein